MSKRFKSQASSARATSGFAGLGGFQTAASPLSYIAEQPDLSKVAEPNLVVSFKNLSKKDSVTKAKALDDLLDSLKDNTDIAILTAWSDLYPRTSIDNSQKVRRNAHILQGNLTAKAGKKIAPLLFKIIPSWLAGTYDSDKSVARAATDALNKTFGTPEKKAALWKVYKDSIYQRVEDALLIQTATTLSDERTTSPDEAEAKYVRVVGSGMRLLAQLLNTGLDISDILYEKKLWEFAHHDDSYLRSATCDLLLTYLSNNDKGLDWSVISTAYLYKGLNKSQLGSSRAYAQALCKLTEVRPTVWTSDYSAKVPVSKRLIQYLRQGSQSGPSETWQLLVRLIRKIPIECWKKTDEDVTMLAEAYRSGVMLERVHIDAAWASYIDLSSWLYDQLENVEGQDSFVEKNLTPLVISYVTKPVDEKWRVGGRSESTAEATLRTINEKSNVSLDKTWTSLVDSTIEKMRLSLPESSKDFRSSQDAVTAQGKRLFALQAKYGTGKIPNPVRTTLLHAALELLKSRNGKPYGAASVVQELVRSGEILDDTLTHFLQNDLNKLIDSPSCEQLVSLAMYSNQDIGSNLLQSSSQSADVTRGIEFFLRNASKEELANAGLQTLVTDRIRDFSNETSRVLAISVLANEKLRGGNLQSELFSKIIDNLVSQDHQHGALSMLEAICFNSPLKHDLAQSEHGARIASKLLILSDSSDPVIADRANTLMTTLHSAGDVASNSVPIIKQQLRGEGDCLSILTLTDLGIKSLGAVEMQDLLPAPEDWANAVGALCTSPTDPSLSITSPLQGVVWLADSSANSDQKIVRDAEDFSLLFRLVFYITKLFANSATPEDASGPKMQALHRWYPVALELVNEKLTSDSANGIWVGSTPEVLHAASDILSEGTRLLSSWLDDDTYVQDWLLRGSELECLDRQTYLTSLAFQRILSRLFDLRPQEVLENYADSLPTIHKSEDILESSAVLSALAEYILGTANGLKIVNELLSQVTQTPSDFKQTALLNILLRGNPEAVQKVPQQRVVFLFKAVVSHLSRASDSKVLSELFRLLSHIISRVQDIYSEAWGDLLQQLLVAWTAANVPMIHSTLQVFAALKRAVTSDKANEDLVSAWSAQKSELDKGLLTCLQHLNTSSDDVDQPRSITAKILQRQLRDVTLAADISYLDLLGSGQNAIRQAAYDLLHRTIPAKQEQLSVDLALDQKVAELPVELLQLIVDADDSQQYLLSWKLVFDHFPKASYRLRESYVSNLKASGAVGSLLDYLCEKLRITSGRPLDASRLRISDYETDLTESIDQDTQWLSVHLYYLSLLYIPSLVKEWFLEQKNRIKQPLEGWTQKYITPLIVASSMVTVIEWSASQSKDQEDRPVEIKASSRGSDLVASITVDPESPPISLSISLPSAYPLESPSVTSRTRVGVSDKNWTSWLRTIQIIIFSSGSIIEGLLAFRKNVQGALKGQSDCAICYSIIGTDMQTPNKKCGTCKNMFHGICLFKWFKSSNSSSCPLCRNNFNYA